MASSGHRWLARMGATLGAILLPSVASAQLVYTVGGDAACSHDDMQQAIDAARTSIGPDFIHLATNVPYDFMALDIDLDLFDDLIIVGGYTSCASSDAFEAPVGKTVLNGRSAPASPPVISIRGAGNIQLINLVIRGANAQTGAGINYRGSATLTLRDTVIEDNIASFAGGGLHAEAVGSRAIVRLEEGTQILRNRAQRGGGLHIIGDTGLYVVSPQTVISANVATGPGGGLFIAGPAQAEISSPGFQVATNRFPVIYDNMAGSGAGIYADARTANVVVDLYSSEAEHPVAIVGNAADQKGGGFYAEAANGNRFTIKATDFTFRANRAPQGALAYFFAGPGAADPAGSFMLGGADARSAGCTRGCNRIALNRSAGGALLEGSVGAGVVVDLNEVELTQNFSAPNLASSILYLEQSEITLRNSRVTGNGSGCNLMQAAQTAITVIDSTIAANDFSACTGELFLLDGASTLAMHRSVIDQPTERIFSGGLSVVGTYNFGTDVRSLPSPDPASSVEGNPRFVDPGFDDFRLRPGSLAVDLAPAAGFFDLDGLPRDKRMPDKINPHSRGPRDVGAYERQSIDNLVMNDTFSNDLRAWKVLSPTVTHDPFDASGAFGGFQSVRILQTAPYDPATAASPVGLTQCIHLPAAGRYDLKAKTYTTGPFTDGDPQDIPSIEWVYRERANEDCSPSSAGGATAAGTLVFSPIEDARGWRASLPTTIPIPAAWNSNSVIELRLKVTANPTQDPDQHKIFALFDNVSLIPGLLVDGFE